MTDGQQDPIIEAYEREETIRLWKDNSKRRKDADTTLREELEFEQQNNEELVVVSPTAYSYTTETPPSEAAPGPALAPPDPETALRRGTIAVSFVLALILLYMWIKGRRMK